MSADTVHVDDRLDEFLDGRLSPEEARAIESHLAACASCRKLRWGVATMRRTLAESASEAPDSPAPGVLAAQLATWLDAEDARTPAAAPPPVRLERPKGRSFTLLAAAALLAVALGAAFWMLRPASLTTPGPGDVPPVSVDTHPDPVERMRIDFLALAGRTELPPALAAADAATVEARWSAAKIPFPVRVLDLGGMGIALAGGDARPFSGGDAARSLYRDPEGGWLLCYMLSVRAATTSDRADEIRRDGGFEFEIRRRGDVTLVLWREGEVVCVLVGGGDAERVYALARAKAMTPPPAPAA